MPSARTTGLTIALTTDPAIDLTTDPHLCRTTKAGAVSGPTAIGTGAVGFRRRTARAITWSMTGVATASRRRRAATHYWVQNGADYLLVAIATGVIAQIIMSR